MTENRARGGVEPKGSVSLGPEEKMGGAEQRAKAELSNSPPPFTASLPTALVFRAPQAAGREELLTLLREDSPPGQS